jgi:hypothetical protein
MPKFLVRADKPGPRHVACIQVLDVALSRQLLSKRPTNPTQTKRYEASPAPAGSRTNVGVDITVGAKDRRAIYSIDRGLASAWVGRSMALTCVQRGRQGHTAVLRPIRALLCLRWRWRCIITLVHYMLLSTVFFFWVVSYRPPGHSRRRPFISFSPWIPSVCVARTIRAPAEGGHLFPSALGSCGK